MTDSQDVVLSGCSGGGKSTVLAELARRGFRTVPEPGRRIVAEEMRGNGDALPWIDLASFARRALAMATTDRQHPGPCGWTFFDRGLVDAAAALEQAGGPAIAATLEGSARYHRRVFLTPPWPELFTADAERRHGWDEALAEYDRLLAAYDALGYEATVLPRIAVAARADFVIAHLG